MRSYEYKYYHRQAIRIPSILNPQSPLIYISAGESSGDLLGADLARALFKENSTVQLRGMGGDRMRHAGVTIEFDFRALSVVGLFEVLRHLPRIVLTLHRIKKYLRKIKPHLMILIDFPDTHFHLMKYAKKLGIPVLYYVSPQIWAWRFHRIKQIQQYVDHMAVLFSFEEKIYHGAGVPVTWVGHPLATLAKSTFSKETAYSFFNLSPQHPIVALFPGSRRSEMHYHLPVLIESAKKISEKLPQTQFVLVLANHFDENIIRKKIPDHIKIIRDHLYDLLSITDVAIAASGTVTLEIACMQVPLCVIYKMHPLTYWLAKKCIRTQYIGLCNIVLENAVVKEFIQDEANADKIANEIIKLLSDKQYHHAIKSALSEIRNKISIAPETSSEKVAKIAMSMC